jgi:ribulose kinase
MYLTDEEMFVPGVWGPYLDAMLPDLWLMVGGQSVSGKLIDHIVETHPATKFIRQKHPGV